MESCLSDAIMVLTWLRLLIPAGVNASCTCGCAEGVGCLGLRDDVPPASPKLPRTLVRVGIKLRSHSSGHGYQGDSPKA